VDIQQVNEGLLADRENLAIDLGLACGADEIGLQRLGGDQPDGQALRLQAAQYRAGEHEGQWGRGGHRQLGWLCGPLCGQAREKALEFSTQLKQGKTKRAENA
jgi:hypothetical protein